jgi:hypothetical protein
MSNEQNAPKSRDYRTGYGQSNYKRALAYERLGIDPASVPCIPFFRASLTRISRSLNHPRIKPEPHARLACKLSTVYQSVPLQPQPGRYSFLLANSLSPPCRGCDRQHSLGVPQTHPSPRLNLHRARVHRNHGRPRPHGFTGRARDCSNSFASQPERASGEALMLIGDFMPEREKQKDISLTWRPLATHGLLFILTEL